MTIFAFLVELSWGVISCHFFDCLTGLRLTCRAGFRPDAVEALVLIDYH
jgi:hypothetical protein